MTEIKIEGNMDRDSRYFLGDTCPCCSTNRHESGIQDKPIVVKSGGLRQTEALLCDVVIKNTGKHHCVV